MQEDIFTQHPGPGLGDGLVGGSVHGAVQGVVPGGAVDDLRAGVAVGGLGQCARALFRQRRACCGDGEGAVGPAGAPTVPLGSEAQTGPGRLRAGVWRHLHPQQRTLKACLPAEAVASIISDHSALRRVVML